MDFSVSVDTCRVCLQNKSSTEKMMTDPYIVGSIPQFKGVPKLESYLDVYGFVAGVGDSLTVPTSASAVEFFPTRICDDCVMGLLAAFEFRRKVLRSEDVLRNLMDLYNDQEEVETVEVIEESEIMIREEVEETIAFDENEQEFEYVNEEMVYGDMDNAIEDDYETTVEDVSQSGPSQSSKPSSIKAKGARYAPVQKEDVFFRGKPLTAQCEDCGKIVSSRSLKMHKLSHENDGVDRPKPHVCEICDARFTLKENLNMHKRIHSNDKRYSCSYCNKKFLHCSSRRYHVDRCHTGKKKYVCEICGAGFCTSSQYVLHTRRHTGATPYPCELCDRKFISGQALKFHMLSHSDDKNFPCNVCGKAYKSRKSLRFHIRTLHDLEKNYVCPICSQAFSQNHVLRTHLLKNHPDYEPPPPGTIVSVRGVERLRSQAAMEPDAVPDTHS